MPKHDPPGDDAALLELERELMELDRAIRVADENREAIDYAPCSRALPVACGRNALKYFRLCSEVGSYEGTAGIGSTSERVRQAASSGTWRSNQRAWAKHDAASK